MSGLPARMDLRPWHDPLTAVDGHDVRSEYAETFWLPVLGPASFVLLRRCAVMFERLHWAQVHHRAEALDGDPPAAVTVESALLAQSIGLGVQLGANGALPRTFDRLRKFKIADGDAHGLVWRVRDRLARVPAYRVCMFPPDLQRRHDELTGVPAAVAARQEG